MKINGVYIQRHIKCNLFITFHTTYSRRYTIYTRGSGWKCKKLFRLPLDLLIIIVVRRHIGMKYLLHAARAIKR